MSFMRNIYRGSQPLRGGSPIFEFSFSMKLNVMRTSSWTRVSCINGICALSERNDQSCIFHNSTTNRKINHIFNSHTCSSHKCNNLIFTPSRTLHFATSGLISGPQGIYATQERDFHSTNCTQINEHSTESERNHDKQEEETSGKKDVIWTIPNALTISRIVLAPILGYMVLQHSYVLACGMFAYAGITDLLDGYIARRYPSQASSFGSYLDPLADKFLVSILFVSLTMVDLIPVALTGLIVLRDALLITAAFYVRYISLPPPITIRRYFDVTHATAQLHPTFISKLNTAVQLSLVATTLAAPVFGFLDHIALQSLWYITAGTTIASGITYIFAKDTFRIIRETKQKKQQAKENQK